MEVLRGRAGAGTGRAFRLHSDSRRQDADKCDTHDISESLTVADDSSVGSRHHGRCSRLETDEPHEDGAASADEDGVTGCVDGIS